MENNIIIVPYNRLCQNVCDIKNIFKSYTTNDIKNLPKQILVDNDIVRNIEDARKIKKYRGTYWFPIYIVFLHYDSNNTSWEDKDNNFQRMLGTNQNTRWNIFKCFIKNQTNLLKV